MARVLWPVIAITTRSGVPSSTRSRAAVRLRSASNAVGTLTAWYYAASTTTAADIAMLCVRTGQTFHRPVAITAG